MGVALGDNYIDIRRPRTANDTDVTRIWRIKGIPYPKIINAAGVEQVIAKCGIFTAVSVRNICSGFGRTATWEFFAITKREKLGMHEFQQSIFDVDWDFAAYVPGNNNKRNTWTLSNGHHVRTFNRDTDPRDQGVKAAAGGDAKLAAAKEAHRVSV